jgi:hypothetical protein
VVVRRPAKKGFFAWLSPEGVPRIEVETDDGGMAR